METTMSDETALDSQGTALELERDKVRNLKAADEQDSAGVYEIVEFAGRYREPTGGAADLRDSPPRPRGRQYWGEEPPRR
jgi:hypothetical protein